MLNILLSIIATVVFAIICLHYWIRAGRIGRLMDKIPGPTDGLPVLGDLLRFISTDDLQLFYASRVLNAEYYPIYKIWLFSWPVINIKHPDHIFQVFSSMKHIEKAPLYELMHPWFRTGLLTSTGKKWQERRKMLTPSFHFNVLQEFISIFNEHSQRLVESLTNEANNEPTGSIVKELVDTFTDFTLNTICETAMGTSLHDKKDFQRKYKKAVHTVGRILAKRLPRPWYHSDWLMSKLKIGKILKENLNYLHEFSNKIIEERKEYHQKTNGKYLINFSTSDEESEENHDKFNKVNRKRLAMLDLLIAHLRDGQIDDNGIREEVDTFMFEGHDTSAMAICFTAMLLAEHKEAQDRARAEIDQVFAKCDGDLTINDYQKMTYLEMCIKESLRLYPSVPFIARILNEDLQLKEYLIPKGVHVFIHLIDTHRDPNYWPDPLKFDPDRFLPENCVGRHPFQYVPFSGGPRNCIGQKFAMLEIKSLFSQLLHNFYLEPIDRASEVQFRPDLVLRPNHPIHVKFVKRHK